MKNYFLILLAFSITACNTNKNITIPFFQTTYDLGGTAQWSYGGQFEHNQSIIAPPADTTQWDKWYASIKEYQKLVRENLNDPKA